MATICFVTNGYPTLPKFGGIAVFTRIAAVALAERGHDVHVLVATRGKARDFSDENVRVHVRPVRWLPLVGGIFPGLGESIGIAWWLRRLDRAFRFDVIEAPNWEGAGLVAALLFRRRLVVRLHTSMAESLSVADRAPTRGERFLMWAERASVRVAAGVVTHSVAHRERLAPVYGAREVGVIPHGIFPPAANTEGSARASRAVSGAPAGNPFHSGEAAFPSEKSDASRAANESPAGARTTAREARALPVLTVGPFNARKGTATLFAAIPLVLAEVPDARFWIVGGDAQHPMAREFLAGLPESFHARVEFLGFLPQEELQRRYGQCAVYASASVYESFGLTFVEAMMRGKPVVGCRASAMPEVIDDGRTGLLVPPGDAEAFAAALVRLLRDADERRRMGDEARRVALERFSAARMAADIEAFYQEFAS